MNGIIQGVCVATNLLGRHSEAREFGPGTHHGTNARAPGCSNSVARELNRPR